MPRRSHSRRRRGRRSRTSRRASTSRSYAGHCLRSRRRVHRLGARIRRHRRRLRRRRQHVHAGLAGRVPGRLLRGGNRRRPEHDPRDVQRRYRLARRARARATGIDAVHPVDGATQASGVGPTMGTAGLATKHAYDLLVGGTSVSGQTEQLDPRPARRPLDAERQRRRRQDCHGGRCVPFSGVQTGDLTFWTVNLVAFRGALSAPP